jgi:hypothetical protein
MEKHAAFHDGKVYVPVFSFTDGAGESFFKTLNLDPNSVGEVRFGEHTAQVEIFRIIENSAEGLGPVISKADAAIMLVRYLDQHSLARLKEVYRLLNAEAFMPKSILVLREPKEVEFKISCTYCGQKLWVRDRDAGRRGSCPQCRKTFFVPTQKSYITSFLMLTDTVPIQSVTSGDSSCKNTLAALIERIVNMEDGLKSSTMRIELPPEVPPETPSAA